MQRHSLVRKKDFVHETNFVNVDRHFLDEEVLVIGGGSSGLDLVALLSQTANHVTCASFPV